MFGFPIPIMHYIVTWGIGIIILSMIIRAIASWFRIDERNAFIRFLARVTDPFIMPVRRIIGGTTMLFDVSFLIAFFLLSTISILLNQALPAAW
jgi:YggT family protein